MQNLPDCRKGFYLFIFFLLQKLAGFVFIVLCIFDFEAITTLIIELWGADFGLGSYDSKRD